MAELDSIAFPDDINRCVTLCYRRMRESLEAAYLREVVMTH